MDENLKDFSTTWIVGGLLMFCLLAFAISFLYSNNSSALDEKTSNVFNEDRNTLSNKLLVESPDSADNLLNVTSNTNPEVSDLGSRDSVAVGYGAMGSGTSYWKSSKKLISYVFSGESGKIILGVVGGLVGLSALFFIWRFIRNGL